MAIHCNFSLTILCVLFITLNTHGQLHDSLRYENNEKTNSLVTEAYRLAKRHFSQGSQQYEVLKNKIWDKFETFLDLVQGVNRDIGKEMQSVVLKRHKEKPFVGFMDLILPVAELMDYVDHCLAQPVEKEKEIRKIFQTMIQNFVDVRNFKNVELCGKTLPDEVTTAQCIIKESIRLNDTMANSLRVVIITKLHQNVRDMNSSIFKMEDCFNSYVPEFMNNLGRTEHQKKLHIVNSAARLLIENKKIWN